MARLFAKVSLRFYGAPIWLVTTTLGAPYDEVAGAVERYYDRYGAPGGRGA